MLKRTKVAKLLSAEAPLPEVLVKGWVRTRRDAKDFSFIEINDGSCLKNIQVIAGNNLPNYEDIKKLSTGSSVAVEGALVPSQGGNQKFEVKYEGYQDLWAAIQMGLAPTAPRTILWMNKTVKRQFSYRFDVFNPRYDILASGLSKGEYAELFTEQMFTMRPPWASI